MQERHKGNVHAKRLRRGFEHDWNWYAEPLKKLLGGYYQFDTHMRTQWLKRKRREQARAATEEVCLNQ